MTETRTKAKLENLSQHPADPDDDKADAEAKNPRENVFRFSVIPSAFAVGRPDPATTTATDASREGRRGGRRRDDDRTGGSGGGGG